MDSANATRLYSIPPKGAKALRKASVARLGSPPKESITGKAIAGRCQEVPTATLAERVVCNPAARRIEEYIIMVIIKDLPCFKP